MYRRTASFATVAAALMLTAVACGGGQPAPQPAAAPPPAPKVLTGQERASWYQDCWNLFGAKSWDAFGACYDPAAESDRPGSGQPTLKGRDAIVTDARTFVTAFPDAKGALQFVLVNGNNIASVAVLTGVHTGPLSGPDGKTIPATNKPIGLIQGHLLETDALGSKAVRESWYADSGTMMAQLGLSKAPARPAMAVPPTPATVVVSSGSETEAKNLDSFRQQIETFNKHDLRGLLAFNAPDIVLRDITQPKDGSPKVAAAMMQEFFRAWPDAKLTPAGMWAAGDYVVVQGTMEGTNKGASPSMGIKQATGKSVRVPYLEIEKFEGGKVKEDWLLMDGMSFATQLGLVGG
jgi:predicted ester cyclase